MKKIDWLIIFLIVFVSLFTLKDLFKPYFYTGHDVAHQVARLYYFDQLLRDGQIPPRWVGGLLNGFGYPLFVFSYHLPWILAEPFLLSGLSIFASIKAVFILGFILSGITMYFFQKELFGRLAALVGTTLYLFAPYRFSNIFVRAAIGDATSFIFPPLVFLSLYKLKKEDKLNLKWIVLGATALAGTLLSHAMVFAFFLMAVLFYVSYWLIFKSKRKIFLISSIFMLILGLGLTSYYLLPSLGEKNLTNFSGIIKSVYYEATFVNFPKLLYSTWGYGTVDAKEGAMSLQVGLAQWLTVLISLAALLTFSLQRKRGESVKEAAFYLLLFLFTIVITQPVSLIFWRFLGNFFLIDFTWRVLAVTIFSASVLAGFVVANLKPRLFLIVILVFLALYGNRNHLRINQILDWPLSLYLEVEKTTNSYNEYTPKWVRQDLVDKKKEKVEFIGQGKTTSLKSSSNLIEFNLEALTAGKLRINTVYYPGWQVLLNGKEVKINYQDSGLIEFPVEKGTIKVSARFRETKFRLASDLLSLASLGFIGWVLFKKKRRL